MPRPKTEADGGLRSLLGGHEAAALAARLGVPAIHAHRTIGSTNDEARRLAGGGAEAGTVVVADQQTAGRGRAGRGWTSPPGQGIWLSMVLRPAADEAVTAIPLRAGLAIAEALQRFVAVPVGVKWPNDVEIDERKVAGVLCEAAWAGGAPAWVVAGVGINVLQSAADLPPELRSTATSLSQVADVEVDRAAVFVAAVAALRAVAERTDDGWAERLAARDALLGRRVEVTVPETGATIVRGTANGIGAQGALHVLDAAGRATAVSSGTVRRLG